MKLRNNLRRCTSQLALALALLSILNSQLSTVLAQGTAFTYQGRLTDGTNVANGNYDVTFSIWTSVSGPSPIAFAGYPVAVSNGLFTITLDFGNGIFTGSPRWLEIAVRTNGSTGAYSTLSPRQLLSAAPYAVMAGNAGSLGGQSSAAFVAKAGDTMTGALSLPANGLAVGSSQLIVSGGNVGIGTTTPGAPLEVLQPDADIGTKEFLRLGYGPSDHHSISAFFNGGAGYSSLSFDVEYASEDIRRVMTLKGNAVGIGTTSPGATLDVRGDVKLGSSGQFYASSGEENLRMVRGTVSHGSILAGSGFSNPPYLVGIYVVTFDSSFASLPSITATVEFNDTTQRIVLISDVTTDGFRIWVRKRSDGDMIDGVVHFIAIGPR